MLDIKRQLSQLQRVCRTVRNVQVGVGRKREVREAERPVIGFRTFDAEGWSGEGQEEKG